MIIVRKEYYAFSEDLKARVLNLNILHPSESFHAYDGNKEELEAIIKSKNNGVNFDKYPCIIMEFNYEVKPDEYIGMEKVSVDSMRFLLCYSAEVANRNDKRYSEVFEPILYPILGEFEKVLQTTANVESYKLIEVSPLPYYGTEQKLNNDTLEVLEVIINITFKKNSRIIC